MKLSYDQALEVSQLVDRKVKAAMAELSNLVLQHISEVQASQVAITRILKSGETFTDEILGDTLMDIEDEAMGVAYTEEPIRRGDTIRAVLRVEKEGSDGDDNYVTVYRIGVKNGEGKHQSGIPELEEHLIGLKVGDQGTVTTSLDGEDYNVHYKVNRVSTKEEHCE